MGRTLVEFTVAEDELRRPGAHREEGASLRSGCVSCEGRDLRRAGLVGACHRLDPADTLAVTHMVNDAATAGSPAGLVVRRLSAEDLSILALESETVAGHMCKVIVLGERIDLDRLRDSIRSRLKRVPELSMRLAEVDGQHEPARTASA